MEKAYTITEVTFETDYLIVVADGQRIRLRISEVSERLARASDEERNNFRISPSGYGIHWIALDEDLSVNGLLNTYRAKYAFKHQA